MKELRSELAGKIVARLLQEKDELTKEFQGKSQINSFFIDNVLDEDFALQVYNTFPSKEKMMELKSLREYKNVAAQMDQYDPLLEEVIYSFQDDRVIKVISEITGINDLLPDDKLYAGGLSLMTQGNFLNPHLDNSHNNDRSLYRVLNLLYYVSPDWKIENGGNLELWDKGPKKEQRTIVSKFNRLVVMITNQASVHSVSKVMVDKPRCCVSNYYFSAKPAEGESYFHVTSFYGRPEERIKNVFLSIDRSLRNTLRKVFKGGVVKTKHIYKK